MRARSELLVRLVRRLVITLIVGAVFLSAMVPVMARPSAMKLFPHDTLVFARVANAREVGEKFKETSTGRMLADPQLAPFVERLYGGTADLYADRLESTLGVSWQELQQLPQGEVAFGFVARANAKPALLLLVDQGDEGSSARRLLDRAIEIGQEKGGQISTEKIGDVDVTVIRDGDNQDRMFGMFERENTIVVATDASVLRGVLYHWDGGDAGTSSVNAGERAPERDGAAGETSGDDEATLADPSTDEAADDQVEPYVPGPTLSENYNFTSILRNSRRPQDPPPNFIFFADPINLAHEVARDSPGAQFGLSYLPALGLDGLLGIGGSLTLATDQYDDLAHLHVLLDNPRAGVLQVLQFEQGETTPEAFVPREIENYYTGYVNFSTTYDRMVGLGNTIVGDGKLEEQVAKRISEPLGIDFAVDIIANLSGRVTLFSGYEKPARMTSRQHILVVELVDEAKGMETLKTVVNQFAERFEERQFGGVTYYAIRPEEPDDAASEQRPINPFCAIMEGHFFIGGSTKLFEQCVAARDGTVERLADAPEYSRVVDAVGRETSGQKPVVFFLQRSEASLRHVYDLISSEKSREFLEEHAADNALFAALLDALDQNELPPFESLLQYMGAGGGVVYDTDTGYHGISFSLRNDGTR